VIVAGTGVIVMWTVAGWPALTVTEGKVVAIVKSSSGMTANDRGTPVAGL
jgi:hypothetical protein